MRANSIIMLVLAVVFGTIAVFLTQSWLQSQASLANRGPAEEAIKVQTIVVAARPLRFGMQLKPDNLKEIPWPGTSIPEGGFGKVSDLLTEDGARFVLSAIEPNEPIYKWKVTGAGARATLSAVVDEGMRAVSIQINDVLGVAGFVLPGDRGGHHADAQRQRGKRCRDRHPAAECQDPRHQPTGRRPDEPTDTGTHGKPWKSTPSMRRNWHWPAASAPCRWRCGRPVL